MAKTRKPHLSGSRFVTGLQCEKRLWLEVNEPDAPELANKLHRSVYMLDQAAVAELAQQAYEGGHQIQASHYDAATGVPATTAALADSKVKAVFGAHFFADNVHVVVDIVEKTKAGLKLVKVKAANSIKPKYMADAAGAMHAVRAAGEKVAAVEIVTLDSTVVFPNLGKLLNWHSVTKDIEAKIKGIGARGAALVKILDSSKAPEVAQGPQCKDPESCPFIGRCKGKAATKTKAKISRLTVDKDELRKALKDLKGPLAFLDFETVAPAVPFLDGVGPYGAIPVQFSLHIETPKGIVEKAWLATPGGDPRPALAKALIEACKGAAMVLQYTTFEAQVIRALADSVPSQAKALEGILSRMFDIKALIKGTVQHPDLRSYTLKDVVPVLCPDLSYDSLTIQNGDAATAVWWRLLLDKTPRTPAEVQKDLDDLRAYCALDSRAMVQLLEKLRELAK